MVAGPGAAVMPGGSALDKTALGKKRSVIRVMVPARF